MQCCFAILLMRQVNCDFVSCHIEHEQKTHLSNCVLFIAVYLTMIISFQG